MYAPQYFYIVFSSRKPKTASVNENERTPGISIFQAAKKIISIGLLYAAVLSIISIIAGVSFDTVISDYLPAILVGVIVPFLFICIVSLSVKIITHILKKRSSNETDCE